MRTQKLTAFAAATAIAIFTAGCGDDSDTESSAPASTPAAVEPATTEPQDIVGVASATEDLSTLVAAVTAAELVETLQGDGPYTVFAPDNAAFEKLGEETVTELTTSKTDDLKAILLNHVVEGDVKAADLEDGQKVATVGGKELTVAIDGDKVTIDGAAVTMPDVATSNGTVHVIDTVIQ
ncbi:MAG: fasciclin domain-containing protein [Solirubrobacteraceae bacterium]|nr:fasciclin domain-containing protein [Solirubrobacteraceae bacterium]